MTVEKIAQTCYELNKAYCESIGDFSFSPWADAPDWQKLTNINGVKFHLDNPDASPSASHESWMKQKEEEGWKYGPVKNPETKEHPAFLPYDQLPATQKVKDFIFRQTVHSLKGLITPPEIFPRRIITIVEKSTYSMPIFAVTDNGLLEVGRMDIQFCKGSKADPAIPRQEGVLTETLIELAAENLRQNNVGDLASRETSMTITKLEEAIMCQDKRSNDRKARGVQGTYQK